MDLVAGGLGGFGLSAAASIGLVLLAAAIAVVLVARSTNCSARDAATAIATVVWRRPAPKDEAHLTDGDGNA